MKDRGEDLVDEISKEDVRGLGDAMKRIKELETKLKLIETQLGEERRKRQEMEKRFDQKLITIFSRMPPFMAGQFYKAMNIRSDRRVENTQRLFDYLDSAMDRAKSMETATTILASIIYGVDTFLALFPPAPKIISKIAFPQKGTSYFTVVAFYIAGRLKDNIPLQTKRNKYLTYFRVSWIAAIVITILFFFFMLYRILFPSEKSD